MSLGERPTWLFRADGDPADLMAFCGDPEIRPGLPIAPSPGPGSTVSVFGPDEIERSNRWERRRPSRLVPILHPGSGGLSRPGG
jgi:hypothetical protein